MNNEIWLEKDMDLLEMLKDEEYDILLQYAQDNQQYLMTKWDTEDEQSFQNTLRFGMAVLQYFEKHLQEKPNETALFRLGALKGALEVFEHLELEKKRNQWISDTFKEVLAIKHMEEIILLLEMHGILNHSEICGHLNLKESTLSEIMKKNDLSKLISSSRSGKYKFYRLTDDGKLLARQLRKH